MRLYTVIGVYLDTMQRYATSVGAESPEEAENKVLAEAEGDLVIAATIDGILGGPTRFVDSDQPARVAGSRA